MNNEKQNKVINDLMENYNELVNQIFRFIYLKTSSKEIAEDLTQDCFLSTVKYLKDKEVRNIRAFLFRTARNKVIDYYRIRNRIIYSDELVLANEKISSRDDIAIKQDARMIIEKLNLLGEEDKEILMMRYIEDMNIKEIAEALGKNEVVVRVRIFRAMQKFKKIVNRK
ncbi:MAG: RNA polymerase, sigma-24 subunit, ECF subfamily [Parcubacteria group bacterium GW2011_GWE2_37_8]|nr:MAG: RNA polymerase, sigma-24 subunit, ECF subfamily [Parcubacteria group bacterium GW2011_GWC2_36_17]KKQ43344.1 MAG: RNA polymerase, sigma-24 subunit, ECF subfamily [Parcubacteria group bacterium GW2011_GWE2_37_8]KKQ58976.1 MAG: RNA polymerase, sigma-24 subunit, ECF subfamily [Parcubacteria group bacterium GW2011_GWD1_38_16]